MCGIAGLIFGSPDAQAGAMIGAMTQCLFHRGPDDGAAVVVGTGGARPIERRFPSANASIEWPHHSGVVALGARRLSIVDRSDGGHQPMSSTDGHAWIVFNGEVYNHVELRDELRGRGMTFRGMCDTEVALAAYRAWGLDCFARFRGMWALAIVDWVAGRVVLSRDRLGIKPLYLAAFERGYAFASEIKALRRLPGVSADVNEARLRDFLVEGLLDHTNDTLFADVWSMQPGAILEIDLRPPMLTSVLGRLTTFWPTERRSATADAGSSASDRLRDLLDESLRLHVRSDVPIGSCLSGGIDSSAIVTSLRSLAPFAPDSTWSQHTFSAVLPGDPLDESRYVNAVHAAGPGLHDHRAACEPARLLDDLDRLLWHQDEPIASPGVFMQWEVMRLAGEAGLSVLLDGQGGDELFCGYAGYWPARLASLVRRGRFLRAASECRTAASGWRGMATLFARCVTWTMPAALREFLRRERDLQRNTHLAPELLAVAEPVRAPYQQRIPRGVRALPADVRCVFDRYCWDLLLVRSLPALLHYEDRSSMAFSIEARVPWLDAPMVDFAMQLPASAKLREGRTKAIVRDAMAGRVPDAVLRRTDKLGFSAPVTRWMLGPLRTWWRDLFASRSMKERGCFEPKGLARIASRFEMGDERWALPIWRAAIVEQWARRMLDQRAGGAAS